ncbi:MAG: DNA/RNA nuclease SfsA [SAR86 cluster bacterium]|uniref:Sugar fermentation stimulation protein homolog n=1 Tax=SAR86 cluster bacterium TaxID=2030880 RepID=A0A2A5B229_9GAMM|nr:MAG: DNA/RNA nuclease SfsA [SAR86 cluster bacterium]
MQLKEPLQQAVLIKRYKRFLADIELPDGNVITIHCPNTGSMKNCQEPGSRIWYTDSGNPKRKYPCTWQIIEIDSKYQVGINTNLANKLVFEALQLEGISQLKRYSKIRTEVAYGEQRSRIDFFLNSPDDDQSEDCYVEVKNVSLGIGQGKGIFPDSVTLRGQKHLQELMHMRDQGHRAVLLFCVQHSGIDQVAPADDIDAEYGRLLRLAVQHGVEVLAYKVKFDIGNSSIELTQELPVVL